MSDLTRQRLDEIADQMKYTTARPPDPEKSAEANWWRGVYSLIDALGFPEPHDYRGFDAAKGESE